jgi:glycosyltransferase involved in cell wall biosynthesis
VTKPYEVEDLAQGIAWILEDRERHQNLCQHAREKAEQEFTLELQAQRYLTLFEEVVESHNRFTKN